MIPPKFIEECEARGGTPWDEWLQIETQALEELLRLAQSRDEKRVSMADSQEIAERVYAPYGDEVVKSKIIGILTYGIGKGYWSMKFFQEDGTPIPDDEAWAQVRQNIQAPEGTPWEWGKKTKVFWVLAS